LISLQWKVLVLTLRLAVDT